MKDSDHSAESLDKPTCDKVMEDMQICIDDWSRQDLDTRAAVVTLVRFSVELAFKFSHTPSDAMQLLSTVAMDNLDTYEKEELIQLLTQSSDQKAIIH